MSRIVKTFLNENGIEHRTTAPYAPHENPTERMNRVVKTMIAQQTGSDHRHWDHHLAEIAFAINTAANESSKFTPAEVIFGKNILGPIQTRLQLKCPDEATIERNMMELWGTASKNKIQAITSITTCVDDYGNQKSELRFGKERDTFLRRSINSHKSWQKNLLDHSPWYAT